MNGKKPDEQHQNPITLDEAAESKLDKLRRDVRIANREADLSATVGVMELAVTVLKLIDYIEEKDVT